MIVFLSIITVLILLFLFVPKGYVVYEGLRFPAWTYRMKRYPQNGLVPHRHDYGEHQRQYLIHYKPKSINTKNHQHIVVYIHGGGWQFGNPEMFRPNAQLLEELGYHSFFLSHRRIPKYNISHQKEDIVKGMCKVLKIMNKEGLTNMKIILGGVSSGANLAALFYLDKTQCGLAGYRKEHFAGLFLMAPPLNLQGMWPSPTLYWLAGKRNGQLFKEASPINYLNEVETIPMLVVHPEKDGMVPLRSTKAFIEKTRELGFGNLEFRVLEEMTHMDAASWCFKDHPSHEIVVKWLKSIQH